MSETFVQHAGQVYKHLPEVYQLEICSACNLQCPMCLRTTDMDRPDGLMDFKLLELMHERGDFRGTAYVELQMAGEPTLHPRLFEIIKFLKDKVGVLVGLSTHGLLIKKKSLKVDLALLDALTISVDSLDPETYHKMRYPAKVDDLLDNLDVLFDFFEVRMSFGNRIPFTELQLIETEMFQGTGNVRDLKNLIERRNWDKLCSVRTVPDCFGEMQGRYIAGTRPRSMPICLNPFSSVSVTEKGDVVSCCFIFDPKKDQINYYGNLYENSLAEIWASDRVKQMQESHMNKALKDQCTMCYQKSPTLIHQNIVSRLVRLGR